MSPELVRSIYDKSLRTQHLTWPPMGLDPLHLATTKQPQNCGNAREHNAMTHAGDSLMSMPMDDARARRRPEAQPEQIRRLPNVRRKVSHRRSLTLKSADTSRARTQPGSKQQQQATGRASQGAIGGTAQRHA